MKYVKRTLLVVFIFAIVSIAFAFIFINFYKKELASLLVEHLKSKYALTLTVKNVDVSLVENFPKASIKLKDVYVNSDLHAGKNPLLTARSIILSINLQKLLKKEFEVNTISIESANINMVTNSDGSKNFEFRDQTDSIAPLPSSSKQSSIQFDIKKISIINSNFNFINEERLQKINITFIDNIITLKKKAEGFDIALTGNIKTGGLNFNAKKGPFLKNSEMILDLKGIWFQNNKSVFISEPSSIEIENEMYAVNTFIQYGAQKKLTLKIDAKQVSYQKAIKLLNSKLKRILSNFAVNKPLDASVLVIADLGIKQDPIVLVRVSSSENEATIGNSKVPYTNIVFKGLILSLDSSYKRGNEEEARIIFNPIKGRVYEVPFVASLKATNFTDPFININASLFINASKVKLPISNEFSLNGNCIAQLSYSGSAAKLNKQEFLNPDMKLSASLTFKNFSYKEHHKPYVYTVNGKTNLTNNELTFNQLHLKTDGGNVTLAGKIDNFAQYALGITRNLKINLSATTNQFSLNPFLNTKVLLKDSTQQKDSTSANAKSSKNEVKRINNESNFEFNVSLKAKKLLVRKVIAENASIDLFYYKSLLNVKSLSVNTCDGKLTATATLDKMETLHADVKVENINVTQLFEQFENFGQKAILSNQLRGKISLNARFNGKFDYKMEIEPSSMDGTVSLKLKDGHLINYEPLLNISNFIFHNRDFNDVTFSEINETFSLKGYQMEIEELEIASNILNLFVSGTYNFKGQSNVNLLIPWSNLRSRGKNYIPKLSGKSADDVRGLKLNYSGMPKKLNLSFGHK